MSATVSRRDANADKDRMESDDVDIPLHTHSCYSCQFMGELLLGEDLGPMATLAAAASWDNSCEEPLIAMSEQSEERSGAAGFRWLWLVLLVPLLYVLSFGPVAPVVVQKGSSQSKIALLRVYYPVIWLHENTPLKRPLEKYVELWGVH
jgi:hypothetical protein